MLLEKIVYMSPENNTWLDVHHNNNSREKDVEECDKKTIYNH